MRAEIMDRGTITIIPENQQEAVPRRSNRTSTYLDFRQGGGLMLVAGNRNETIINDYWTKLDKLNRERAAEVIKLREREQQDSYDKAVKPYIKPATEAPKKKIIRKKYDHDLFTTHGDRIAELYKQGRTKRQIALHFGISPHTVKRIVVRLGLEKEAGYEYDR